MNTRRATFNQRWILTALFLTRAHLSVTAVNNGVLTNNEGTRRVSSKRPKMNEQYACYDVAKNELCSRPLIVLKLPRSGSSYLAEQMRESVTGNEFGVEVTNELPESVNCSQVVAAVEAALLKSIQGTGIAGFTLNPFKFHNTGLRCGDQIAALVREHRGVIAVLERDNVVAQAASFLISTDVRRKRLLKNLTTPVGCGEWHLDQCGHLPDYVVHHRISPVPLDFLKKVEDMVSLTRELKQLAKEWTHSDYKLLSFEQIIQFPVANRTLPEWIQSCILCGCDCDEIPSRNFVSRTSLKDKVDNYKELRDYVATNAPHFLHWFEDEEKSV